MRILLICLLLTSCSSTSSSPQPQQQPPPPQDEIVGRWENLHPLMPAPIVNAADYLEFTADGKLIKEIFDNDQSKEKPIFRRTGTWRRLDDKKIQVHYDEPFAEVTDDTLTIHLRGDEMAVDGRGYKNTYKRVK